MDPQIQEALDILQEECAEVIVEISKCRRFGLDSMHYKTGVEHRAMLEAEIGDMLALVHILVAQGILSIDNLEQAADNKKRKLEQWSNIFNTQKATDE
jgi:NTP pyrophosphatase (non-canonical NTP hydrolase)